MRVPLSQFSGNLIGLIGFAGSGKDTICEAAGFPRAAFADALKADLWEVAQRIDLDPWRDKKVMRPVLVAYGEMMRGIDPDYWIKRISLPDEPLVCITDCRYKNEVRAIKDRGGIAVFITRPGTQPANAEEDRSIGEIWREHYFDAQIVNEDPAEAAGQIKKLIEFGWDRAAFDCLTGKP